MSTLRLLNVAAVSASLAMNHVAPTVPHSIIEETRVSAAVRRYLERYCKATGVEFAACRDWFETYLLAKGGEEERLPWHECLQMLRSASRSVFSG